MNTEQERAEFEVWYTEEYTSHIPRSGNGYSNLDTELAWQAYQAGRAALQSQDREDAADLFWDADDTEDCLYAYDEETAVERMVENAWPTDFPLHFTLQRAVRLPSLNIKVTSMSDCGTDIQYERAAIDHARRVEEQS